MNLRGVTNPPPQIIEAIGIALLIVVVAGTGYVLCSIPDEELTRAELLRVLEVGFTALAGTSLLFLWAASACRNYSSQAVQGEDGTHGDEWQDKTVIPDSESSERAPSGPFALRRC
jgi:hypothetical protein